MVLGIVTFLLALGASGYLLYRVAVDNRTSDNGAIGTNSSEDGPKTAWFRDKENLLKLIILLALSAALFTAKLWPLALMILIAAGSITAVEFWKQQHIASLQNPTIDTMSNKSSEAVTVSEALNVLGLSEKPTAIQIREAHKKLIAQLHPDRGGTDYLAAKINESRSVLIAEFEKDETNPN